MHFLIVFKQILLVLTLFYICEFSPKLPCQNFFLHIALFTLSSQCEMIRPLTAAVWCSLRHNWDYAIRYRSFVMSHDILFRVLKHKLS